MNTRPNIEQVVAAARSLTPELLRIVHTLYEDPELPLMEKNAAALLSGILQDNGFEVSSGIAGMETAFIASTARVIASPLETFSCARTASAI